MSSSINDFQAAQKPVNTAGLTLLLAGLSMLGPFSIDTFLPSLPAIAQDFSVSAVTAQQTLSAYLLAFAAMSLFYGTLSDSFGRRRVILAALVLFTVASVCASFAPTFGWLIVARVLQGLAAGAGVVIGLAVVRDRFSGAVAHRMMSQITMVFGLAPAIAPIVGGFLHVAFGWRSVFVFMAAIGVVLLVASSLFLAESLPAERRVQFHPVTLAQGYWEALSHRAFVARILAVGCIFGGYALHIASASNFVLNVLHLPETGFGWLFVPMVGGMVAGSFTGGRLVHRISRQQVLHGGWVFMGVASVADIVLNASMPAALPWAVLPIMLFTFGLGLAMPAMNMMTLELLPHRSGLAASLLNFVRMGVFSIVSGLVAPLLFGSALRLAEGLAVTVVLSFVFWQLGRTRPAASATLAGARAAG